MMEWLSKLVDLASEYFAHRKGLLPIIGLMLIILNLLLVIVLPATSPLAETNFFLHLGLIIALIGIMLSWAL